LQLFNNIRGQQDAADVLDMVVFTTDQITGQTNKRIIVIGYSFGACLAAQALVHPSIVAFIGISFPLGGLSFLLRSKDAFNKVWSASHVPRLLVLGSDDQYTKQKAMQNAMAAGGGVLLDTINTNSGQIIPPLKTSGKTGPKSLLLKMFEGNSHFWENDCSLMVEFVLRYCEQVLQMQEPE